MNNEEQVSSDQFSGINSEVSEKHIRWQYLVHDIAILIKEFIFGPSKKKNSDLNLLQQAAILMETKTDSETIALCKELIKIHRVHENTKSRKRLEIWATILITTYLVAICVIFILTAACFKGRHLLHCEPEMMVALLTTTTINIIGLVVIVLKGYFPQKELKKKSEADAEDDAE